MSTAQRAATLIGALVALTAAEAGSLDETRFQFKDPRVRTYQLEIPQVQLQNRAVTADSDLAPDRTWLRAWPEGDPTDFIEIGNRVLHPRVAIRPPIPAGWGNSAVPTPHTPRIVRSSISRDRMAQSISRAGRTMVTLAARSSGSGQTLGKCASFVTNGTVFNRSPRTIATSTSAPTSAAAAAQETELIRQPLSCLTRFLQFLSLA